MAKSRGTKSEEAMPEKKHKKPTNAPKPPKTPTPPVTTSGQPVFAQPKPSPDPSGFKDPVTDQNDNEINLLSPVPMPLGVWSNRS